MGLKKMDKNKTENNAVKDKEAASPDKPSDFFKKKRNIIIPIIAAVLAVAFIVAAVIITLGNKPPEDPSLRYSLDYEIAVDVDGDMRPYKVEDVIEKGGEISVKSDSGAEYKVKAAKLSGLTGNIDVGKLKITDSAGKDNVFADDTIPLEPDNIFLCYDFDGKGLRADGEYGALRLIINGQSEETWVIKVKMISVDTNKLLDMNKITLIGLGGEILNINKWADLTGKNLASFDFMVSSSPLQEGATVYNFYRREIWGFDKNSEGMFYEMYDRPDYKLTGLYNDKDKFYRYDPNSHRIWQPSYLSGNFENEFFKALENSVSYGAGIKSELFDGNQFIDYDDVWEMVKYVRIRSIRYEMTIAQSGMSELEAFLGRYLPDIKMKSGKLRMDFSSDTNVFTDFEFSFITDGENPCTVVMRASLIHGDKAEFGGRLDNAARIDYSYKEGEGDFPPDALYYKNKLFFYDASASAIIKKNTDDTSAKSFYSFSPAIVFADMKLFDSTLVIYYLSGDKHFINCINLDTETGFANIEIPYLKFVLRDYWYVNGRLFYNYADLKSNTFLYTYNISTGANVLIYQVAGILKFYYSGNGFIFKYFDSTKEELYALNHEIVASTLQIRHISSRNIDAYGIDFSRLTVKDGYYYTKGKYYSIEDFELISSDALFSTGCYAAEHGYGAVMSFTDVFASDGTAAVVFASNSDGFAYASVVDFASGVELVPVFAHFNPSHPVYSIYKVHFSGNKLLVFYTCTDNSGERLLQKTFYLNG